MSAEWDEQQEVTRRPEGPGAQLAAQRQALGWSVEQVAEQLKLARRQIIALEADDYAALPGPAVVRGFVRAYAKVLRMDANPLVALVVPDTPAAPEVPAPARRDKNNAFAEVRFPTGGKRELPLVAIGIAVAAVIGLGLAYEFAWAPAHPGSHADVPSASASAAAALASLAASVQEAPADKAIAPPIESTTLKANIDGQPASPAPAGAALTAPANKPAASVPAAPAPAPAANTSAALSPAANLPAAAAPAPAAQAVNKEDALVLNVREDSWIEIRRVNGGPSIAARLVKGGNTETFEIHEPVLLIVGHPDGVDATLRGNTVELKPVPGGTISRVKLN